MRVKRLLNFIICLIILMNKVVVGQQIILNTCYKEYSRDYYSMLIEDYGVSIVSFKEATKYDKDSVLILSVEYNNGDFPDLSSFKNLLVLFIYGDFNSLPSKAFSNKNIKGLEINCYSKHNFLKISQEITSLNQLFELNIRSVNFDVFPEIIWMLNSIESIRLQNCIINNFYCTSHNMCKLRKLEFDQCKVKNAKFGNIKDLEALTITNSTIPNIDSLLILQPSLKYLGISGIKLENIMLDIISKISSLQCLKFINCNLKQFPDAIIILNNLQLLMLSENKISQFPQIISKMENLVEFWINDNRIKYKVDLREIQKDYPQLRIIF